MSDYSYSASNRESPLKYNPKVNERKLQPHTDWAQLVRYQQAMAEKMIQQERELKELQRAELNGVLDSLVSDKQNVRRMELQAKQDDYMRTTIAKQQFDQYLARMKEQKVDLQKGLATEYDRERQYKDEDFRRKLNHERQIEDKIVYDALDSLSKERVMNEKKRNDYHQTMEQQMYEKEMQKRMQNEQVEQNRQDHIRLMEENARNLDMKEQNYRMYYQRVNEKQSNRQNIFDGTVGQEERHKNRHLNAFIDKGVEVTKRKVEEEDARRQRLRQEQISDVNQTLRSKIRENEDEKAQEKLAYANKVEELKRKNEELNNFNEQMRKVKSNQQMDYKSVLEQQMRDAEMMKRKQQAEMLEYEKKMHLHNFEGFIPGIKSSKVDELVSPQMKTSKMFSPVKTHTKSPTNNINLETSSLNNSGFSGGSAGRYPDYIDEIKSPKNQANLSGFYQSEPRSPISQSNIFGGQSNIFGGYSSPKSDYSRSKPVIPKQEAYNPITNPVAHNIQNPYIVKDIQRGGFLPRNYLAVMADKNLLGHAN